MYLELWGLVAVGDGLYVEVDEPDQRVLVHGLNVGQVRDAEEKNGGVRGHGLVAVASLVYFYLRGSGYFLLGRDLGRKCFGRREDLDGCFVL